MAHHVQLHTHGLITEDIAKIVLDNFCETVAELIGQEQALQPRPTDNDLPVEDNNEDIFDDNEEVPY